MINDEAAHRAYDDGDWKNAASLANAALRRELLALAAEDQAARKAWLDDPSDHHDASITLVDRRSTARLTEIVDAVGWPGESLVGRDASYAAWLIAQHADHDRAFQEYCLSKLAAAVALGEAEVRCYAYLVDRVAVANGAEQTYGTQFDERLEPAPIADAEHVDERRRSVGLCSLEEYRTTMKRQYRPQRANNERASEE